MPTTPSKKSPKSKSAEEIEYTSLLRHEDVEATGQHNELMPGSNEKIPFRVRCKKCFASSYLVVAWKDAIAQINSSDVAQISGYNITSYRLIITTPVYIVCFIFIACLTGLNAWALTLELNTGYVKQAYGNYFWLIRSIYFGSIVLLFILIIFLTRIYLRQDYSLPVKVGAAVIIFIIHIFTVVLYVLNTFNTNIIIDTRAKILYNLLFTQVTVTYTTLFLTLIMYSIIILFKK